MIRSLVATGVIPTIDVGTTISDDVNAVNASPDEISELASNGRAPRQKVGELRPSRDTERCARYQGPRVRRRTAPCAVPVDGSMATDQRF
jgi:hypothetical protein